MTEALVSPIFVLITDRLEEPIEGKGLQAVPADVVTIDTIPRNPRTSGFAGGFARSMRYA